MPPATSLRLACPGHDGRRRVPDQDAPPAWPGLPAGRGPAQIGPAPPSAADAVAGALGPLSRLVRALIPGRGWDLTLRQLAVVLLVHDGGAPRTCCALAERLAIPRPAMTRALHRLAALGLVRRATDPVCRRRVLVRPTTRGRAFVGALRRCLARDAC